MADKEEIHQLIDNFQSVFSRLREDLHNLVEHLFQNGSENAVKETQSPNEAPASSVVPDPASITDANTVPASVESNSNTSSGEGESPNESTGSITTQSGLSTSTESPNAAPPAPPETASTPNTTGEPNV